eukprot:1156520-Pelagomonas_calceolata.AAC.8
MQAASGLLAISRSHHPLGELRRFRAPLQGLQGVGLQPETLADGLMVKDSQPASKAETNSDKNKSGLPLIFRYDNKQQQKVRHNRRSGIAGGQNH